jgi:xanthine dehydrogenase YagS FAD-binding subunit
VRCRKHGRGSGLVQLQRPESIAQAVALLDNGSARALAGGTELVPLLRDGIVTAETLVDIRGVVPKGREGLKMGAATTLAELEVDPEIPDALREACRLAASPQLRNMSTVGGNLLQATRCWYWRLNFPCWLHGGDVCHARQGQHREHAIFGNERCASAHPSDIAAALLALRGRVRTDRRELSVAELYRLPTEDDRETTTLERGELILELEVEAPRRSTYLKAMDRKRWAFALVGVAAARYDDDLRLALAGVAPIPWELPEPGALDTATPLPGTAYKVEIARALIRRATAQIAG